MNKLIGKMLMEAGFEQLFVLLIGFLCITASLCNWDFWFESRKLRFISKFIGRTGARILYGLFGLGFSGYVLYSMFI